MNSQMIREAHDKLRLAMGPMARRTECLQLSDLVTRAAEALRSAELDLSGHRAKAPAAGVKRRTVLVLLPGSRAATSVTADYITDAAPDETEAASIELCATWIAGRDLRSALSDETLRAIRVQVANAIADELAAEEAADEMGSLDEWNPGVFVIGGAA